MICHSNMKKESSQSRWTLLAQASKQASLKTQTSTLRQLVQTPSVLIRGECTTILLLRQEIAEDCIFPPLKHLLLLSFIQVSKHLSHICNMQASKTNCSTCKHSRYDRESGFYNIDDDAFEFDRSSSEYCAMNCPLSSGSKVLDALQCSFPTFLGSPPSSFSSVRM